MQDCSSRKQMSERIRNMTNKDRTGRTREFQRFRQELIHTRRSALIFILVTDIRRESDDGQSAVNGPVVLQLTDLQCSGEAIKD